MLSHLLCTAENIIFDSPFGTVNDIGDFLDSEILEEPEGEYDTLHQWKPIEIRFDLLLDFMTY